MMNKTMMNKNFASRNIAVSGVSLTVLPEPLGSGCKDRPWTSLSNRFPSSGHLKYRTRRLMERTELDSRKPKLASYWGVTRDDGMDIGHSEYITRLTALRDSLMDQEQVYLAQALDRLRIHSLTNKSSTYRLRMINDEIEGRIPLAAPRKSMQTTVEKFRQMRIKPHHPSIFPIQGTQLLEQKSPRKGNSKESKRDAPLVENVHKPSKAKIDESIQANLQRLLQPRSSIPNIGRKAIKQQENLEVKPKPFSNIRSRVYRNTGKHPSTQVVKFYLSPTDISSRDLQLYGASPGLDPGYVFLKEETLDVDTVRDCNYDTYLVPPSSREPSNSDSLEKDNFDLSENCSNHEGTNVAVNANTAEGKGIETSADDLEKQNKDSSVPTSSRNVISVFIPNNSVEDINGYSFYSSDEEPPELAQRPSLPKKQALGKETLKVADRSNGTRRYSSPIALSEQNGGSRKKAGSYRSGRSPGLPDTRTAAHGKRHSDDSPAIILNPGTPDVGLAQRNKIAIGQKTTTLERAVKQKEIRQRELENLFDDVRELNMNIDQYTSRSLDTTV